jgi:hypothetical protein
MEHLGSSEEKQMLWFNTAGALRSDDGGDGGCNGGSDGSDGGSGDDDCVDGVDSGDDTPTVQQALCCVYW